jgi:hypothetical protein
MRAQIIHVGYEAASQYTSKNKVGDCVFMLWSCRCNLQLLGKSKSNVKGGWGYRKGKSGYATPTGVEYDLFCEGDPHKAVPITKRLQHGELDDFGSALVEWSRRAGRAWAKCR